jgi:uncharacterized protein YjbJ (UPF0337 family)
MVSMPVVRTKIPVMPNLPSPHRLGSTCANPYIIYSGPLTLLIANAASKVSGSAAEVSNKSAAELRGEAKGKAEELKGKAKGAVHEAEGKIKGA